NEDLGVGAAPAGDRVPARSRLVPEDDPGGPHHRVVTGHHVVEGAVIVPAAGDPVDRGVDEAQVPARILVGQGDHGRPQRVAALVPWAGSSTPPVNVSAMAVVESAL